MNHTLQQLLSTREWSLVLQERPENRKEKKKSLFLNVFQRKKKNFCEKELNLKWMRELTKPNLHPGDLNQARKQRHNVGFTPPSDPLEGQWWGTSEVLWAEDCLPALLWSHRLVDDQIYSIVVFHKWKHAKWAMPLVRSMKLCVIQWGQMIFHLLDIEKNGYSGLYSQYQDLSMNNFITDAFKIPRAEFQHKQKRSKKPEARNKMSWNYRLQNKYCWKIWRTNN